MILQDSGNSHHQHHDTMGTNQQGIQSGVGNIVNRNGEDVLYVPKVSKLLPIIKCTESFTSLLHQPVVKINIPLSYFIRESDDVPVVVPLMMRGNSYSGENGSVDKQLIMRASHTHHRFNKDISKVS